MFDLHVRDVVSSGVKCRTTRVYPPLPPSQLNIKLQFA